MCPSEPETPLPPHIPPQAFLIYIRFKYLSQIICALTSKFYFYEFSKCVNTLNNGIVWHSALPSFCYLIPSDCKLLDGKVEAH